MKSKDLGTEEDLPPVNRNTNSSQPSTTTTSFPSPQRPKQHAFRSRKNGRTNQKQSNRNLVIHIGKQVQYAKNSNANNNSSPYNCKVVMSIRAHNSGHSDGTVIEWKPNTVVRMFELIYATKGLTCELHVGSMNDITDKIAETFTSVHQIRQFPGSSENDPLLTSPAKSGRTYDIMQTTGVFEIDANDKFQASDKIDAIAHEIHNIVKSDGFFLAYKYAAYWEHCLGQNADIPTLFHTIETATIELGSIELAFQKADNTGGIYRILLKDRDNVLRGQLGSNPMEIKSNLALDEMFLDEEVAHYTQVLLGNYSPVYRPYVFKTANEKRDVSFLTSFYSRHN